MSGDGSEPEDRREPLEALADQVGERRDAMTSEAADELFAEETFEELGRGEVWDAIEAEATEDEFDPVSTADDTAVVAKREFCERCRHFAEPPDASCTHDGTEIREFVDRAHVEVANCPIVEERALSSDVTMD